ncbi:MAG: Xaa-Pro dipeptidase, partial [Myxococcales bacterium]|nr:Xaa-Pro dipeptidase [Myxococcales bacterium]
STAFMHVLDVRRVATPELPAGKRVAWIGDDVARAEALGIASDDRNPTKLLAALDRLRTTKTGYEIACLVEANRRAALGHEAVRRAFAEGDHAELDLHLLYLRTTRQDDPETPYKNIVATGRNASILHHVSYGRDATRAESLLLDAGATCLGYCSDITRTWVKTGGAASAAFIAILDGMEAMQKRLVAQISAGAPYEDLHDESHRQVSAILKEAGIVKASADEIDGKAISRIFYPHGLGHSLGLQTHDVGCAVVKPKTENPFLRNTSKIAEGQVFTIEPGLYFVDSLLAPLRGSPEGKLVDWNLVEALSPLGGIRIEDDVLVTSSGTRNFTREVLPVGGSALE